MTRVKKKQETDEKTIRSGPFFQKWGIGKINKFVKNNYQ